MWAGDREHDIACRTFSQLHSNSLQETNQDLPTACWLPGTLNKTDNHLQQNQPQHPRACQQTSDTPILQLPTSSSPVPALLTCNALATASLRLPPSAGLLASLSALHSSSTKPMIGLRLPLGTKTADAAAGDHMRAGDWSAEQAGKTIRRWRCKRKHCKLEDSESHFFSIGVLADVCLHTWHHGHVEGSICCVLYGNARDLNVTMLHPLQLCNLSNERPTPEFSHVAQGLADADRPLQHHRVQHPLAMSVPVVNHPTNRTSHPSAHLLRQAPLGRGCTAPPALHPPREEGWCCRPPPSATPAG